MATIKFRVNQMDRGKDASRPNGALPPQGALPPKKGSMWTNKEQRPRLVALRRAALAQFEDGKPEPFPQGVRVQLTLRVYLEREEAQRVEKERGNRLGDLDNFVSGVCDGLGEAPPHAKEPKFIQAIKELKDADVRPTEAIVLADDKWIVRIVATKEHGDKNWYEIEVTDEVAGE